MDELKNLSKLSINDWRVLNLFYRSVDWRNTSLCIREVKQKLGFTQVQARYSLSKLERQGYLESIHSFIKFYQPKKDDDLRRTIGEQYKTIVLSLLRRDEK